MRLKLTKHYRFQHKFVIELYYTILSKKPKTEAGKQQLAIYELCTELTYYWVFFNLPPKTYNGVKYMLQCDFKEIEKLKRTAVSKRNDKWNSDCGRIIDKLNDGYDIRSSNAEAIVLMKLWCRCNQRRGGVLPR